MPSYCDWPTLAESDAFSSKERIELADNMFAFLYAFRDLSSEPDSPDEHIVLSPGSKILDDLMNFTLMESPAGERVRELRQLAGLSQPAAAALIYSTKRTWQDWEAGKSSMHPGLWELFLIKTGQCGRNPD